MKYYINKLLFTQALKKTAAKINKTWNKYQDHVIINIRFYHSDPRNTFRK